MKKDHLALAKEDLAKGDAHYAKAAKHMLAAREEGKSYREIAEAVDRTYAWTLQVVTWAELGCVGTPFGGKSAEDKGRGAKEVRRVLSDAPAEQVEAIVAQLPVEAKAKLANALYQETRQSPVSDAVANESRQAAAPLNRAVNSFAAVVGTAALIDQATEEINQAVANDGLTVEALHAIEEAVERLTAAIDFAKTMGGVA